MYQLQDLLFNPLFATESDLMVKALPLPQWTQTPFVFPSLQSTWNHISRTYQLPFPEVPTRDQYENKTLICQMCKGRLVFL